MFRNDSAHTGVFNDGGTHPNNVTLWNYSFGSYIVDVADNSTYASPTVVNNVVYEGSLGNNMTAFNAATGAVLWSVQNNGDVHSSAAVENGIVYYTDYDNKLYALNAATGATVWGPANIGAASHSSPAVANGVVYAMQR